MFGQKGVSLILSLFILAALLSLGFLIADLTLRQGRTTQEAEASEVAFYAAEAGMEKVLYEINKNKVYRIEDLASQTYPDYKGTLSESGGEWEIVGVEKILRAPPYEPKLYTPLEGDISSINPLKVDLASQESFQLGLDLNLEDYPQELKISWEDQGLLIVFTWLRENSMETGTQTVYSSPPPEPLVLDPLNYYIFRVINLSGGERTYTFQPNTGANLPLGVFITVSGSYRDLTREVETENARWQIY
jgi:hypothetical protein